MDDSVSTSHPYLQVHNPSFDYVPPALISLFITGEVDRRDLHIVFWGTVTPANAMGRGNHIDQIPCTSHPIAQIKDTASCQAMCTDSCTSGIINRIGDGASNVKRNAKITHSRF